MIPGKVYDVLKWLCVIFLPAVSTLYFALGNIWSFPYIEQITGTIAAIEVFIGAIIGISTYNYNKSK